jgi:hypothetical protein
LDKNIAHLKIYGDFCSEKFSSSTFVSAKRRAMLGQDHNAAINILDKALRTVGQTKMASRKRAHSDLCSNSVEQPQNE